jgi:putative ABC transport system substrate-binding protein
MYTFKNLTKIFTFSLFAFAISFSFASQSSQNSPLKISILQVIEHPALDATRKGFLEELKTLGYEEGKNLTLEYQSAQGNANLAAQIAQKFTADQPNVIVAIGTKAAQAAMNATKDTKIPIVFSSVTDPRGANLVNNLEAPKGHVTGVSNFLGVEPQFQLFKKVMPNLKTLGVIYDSGEANSISLNKAMEELAPKYGLKLVFAVATKTSEVFTASQSLCGKADALFVNNDNTALGAFGSVVKAAQGCGIPAFVSDVDMGPQGALAAVGPDQTELGRQTARMVDTILKNPDAPLPAVEFPKKTEEYVKL